jgi:xylitol oxidase
MDKRTFLRTSSLLLGGAAVLPLPGCKSSTSKKNGSQVNSGHLKNWAGNVEYGTGNVHYPKTLEEVQEIVKKK